MELGDPLKLIPLLITVIAGICLAIGRIDVQGAVGLLTLAVGAHSAISAINNRNPKDS